VIGWDIGGAHLKAARIDGLGRVVEVLQLPCPLWQGLHHLHAGIAELTQRLGTVPLHAVTMTGEMVDLFPDRATGVSRLVDATVSRLANAHIRFYAGAGGFLDAGPATLRATEVASANWMATAALVAARQTAALLVDIGSTTTDLIPVHGGQIRARGRDDASRLVSGELLYTGVVRTPLMALAPQAPFSGDWVPLMAEHFATTADLYRILESLPDDADLHPAADGGVKTVEASARRLARMLGRDLDSAPLPEWKELARWLADVQRRRIGDACARMLSRHLLAPDSPIVIAGIGRFIAAELARSLARPCLDFATLIPCAPAAAQGAGDCAPAVAVAWLAMQQPD
jgi:probable H4MPT-linked C1 transfer pathway protein